LPSPPTVISARGGRDDRRRVPGGPVRAVDAAAARAPGYGRILDRRRPVRLAIVSEFELVVAGVKGMLAAYGDRVVVVEPSAQWPIPEDVDVVLCDSTARPVRGGIDSHELAGRGVTVIAFDCSRDPGCGDPAVTPGVSAHLSQCLTGAQLVEAVEAVCGRRAAACDVQERDEVSRSGDWPGAKQGLTQREAEILGLIARGLSNQEIADAVYLSINSVKTHIRTAYRKLGVTRRAQAVGWGFRHGYAAVDARDGRALGAAPVAGPDRAVVP
jgi:two-component system, NarL family, response regulator LiaR